MTRPATRSPDADTPTRTWTHGEHARSRGRTRTRALDLRPPALSVRPLARGHPMMFRSARLEREIDRAVDDWLRWLARWDPIAVRRRRNPCEACPRWAIELEFENLPHSVLHALVVPVAASVDDCFERSARTRFPDLASVEDRRQPSGETARAVPPEAQHAVEIDLAILYGRVRHTALQCINARRGAIQPVLEVHVEPKVQWLADQLLIEIGA